jgi:hypothetical protein
MSSLKATSGAGAGAGDGPDGNKRGRPLGSLDGAGELAATPVVPRRRGRPLGSRNKKTLAALAAAAATEPFGASRSSAIVTAPGGITTAAASGAVAPAAAAPVAGLTGTPLEAAAALVGAVMAFGAAPPGLAGLSVGGSSSAAAKKVRAPPQCPPTKQQLSYVLKHGFATAMVPLLAGSKERLPLPASFVGTMGKNPPTSFMIEDGSGGQPLYDVEVLHDEEGKSYLTGGWERFFTDYGLERGWSLILTHRARSPILCVRVIDGSGCARAYFPWP